MNGSLFSLLLQKRFRLPRWMRIEEWRAVRRNHGFQPNKVIMLYSVDYDWYFGRASPSRCQRWRRLRLYERARAGPFYPLRDCNLVATSLITGQCEQDAWLRVPRDVWKLIFLHLPFVAELMAPVCTYFRDCIKTFEGQEDGEECTDHVWYRQHAFKDYVPRVSRKSRLRDGPHFGTRSAKQTRVGGTGDWITMWTWSYHVSYLSGAPTLATAPKMYLAPWHPRVRSPIVASKRFQEFEWRPEG